MATLKSLVDETSNIKNELKNCHTTLKNNLIEKGVEVLPSYKMSTLISKINNIKGYILSAQESSNTIIFGKYTGNLTYYTNEKGTYKKFTFDRVMKGFYNVRIYGANFGTVTSKSYVSIVLDGVEICKIRFNSTTAYTQIVQFETNDVRGNSTLEINYVGEGINKGVALGDCSVFSYVKEL